MDGALPGPGGASGEVELAQDERAAELGKNKLQLSFNNGTTLQVEAERISFALTDAGRHQEEHVE